MKYTTKMFFCLIAIVAMFVSFAACSSESQPRTALVIIGGDMEGSQPADYNLRVIREALGDVAEHGGIIALLVPDGNSGVPGALRVLREFEPDTGQRGTAGVRELRSEGVDSIIEDIVNYGRATAKEVDLLSAIRVADRWLSQQPGDWNRVKIIHHSGLQTTAPLDLQTYTMFGAIARGVHDTNHDIDRIVQHLSTNHQISSQTSDAEVIWIGMGATVSPQSIPTERQAEWISNMWTAIFSATGNPNEIRFLDGQLTDRTPANLPRVTQVFLGDIDPPSLEVIVEDEPVLEVVQEEIAEVIEDNFQEALVLSENLRFVANSRTEFQSPEIANAIAEEVATAMINNPNLELLVYGTTTWSRDFTLASTRSFSLDRANTFRNAVLEAGNRINPGRINPDNLIAFGASWEHPRHNAANPMSDENRLIVVVNLDSDEARDVLNRHGS